MRKITKSISTPSLRRRRRDVTGTRKGLERWGNTPNSNSHITVAFGNDTVTDGECLPAAEDEQNDHRVAVAASVLVFARAWLDQATCWRVQGNQAVLEGNREMYWRVPFLPVAMMKKGSKWCCI